MENDWEIGIRENMWTMMKKCDGMCKKCCDAGRGNIQICCYFTRSLHKDVHYHPIYSKVYVNGMIVEVEAAMQRVTMGEEYGAGVDVCG